MIKIDKTVSGGSLYHSGSGSCISGSDYIYWYEDNNQADMYQSPGGFRCDSDTSTINVPFNEIRIDVVDIATIYLNDITLEYPGDKASSTPSSTQEPVDPPAPSRPGLDTGDAPGLIVPLNSGGDEDHDTPTQLAVYGINGENGYLAFVVTVEEIVGLNNWPKEQPYASSNDGKLNFYILGNNECQVNIGPDNEGKVQEIVMTCDTFTFIRRSEFNVNTVFAD